MVWGAFSYNGTLPLQEIFGRQTAASYIGQLLKCSLATEGPRLCGKEWIFMQDNAAIHNAKKTMEFFKEKNIKILDHPACSPDLNPIENLWGWVSKEVFKNGRQYENVEDLKEAMLRAWNEIPDELIKNLIESMPDRIYELIVKKGSHTHY